MDEFWQDFWVNFAGSGVGSLVSGVFLFLIAQHFIKADERRRQTVELAWDRRDELLVVRRRSVDAFIDYFHDKYGDDTWGNKNLIVTLEELNDRRPKYDDLIEVLHFFAMVADMRDGKMLDEKVFLALLYHPGRDFYERVGHRLRTKDVGASGPLTAFQDCFGSEELLSAYKRAKGAAVRSG